MQSWQEQWRAVAILAQVTRRSLGSDTGAGAMASSTLAAVKAQAHGGYPKATAAARGAAAMASRSTGQTTARTRSPLRVHEGLSLREHAVVAVAAAREAADAAHKSLKHMHIATESRESLGGRDGGSRSGGGRMAPGVRLRRCYSR